MTEFLLKSTLCLLILYLLSWAVTQKSSNFLFIRFLLVASVLFSLILPLVHIETSEMPVSFNQAFSQPFANSTIVENESISKNSPERRFTSETIFIIVYFAVALILLIRYLWNIWNLNQLYRHSERLIFKGKRIALIKKNLGPFTFMNTIFINKTYWEEGKIDESLILHEIAHCNQKHTLDLLFIKLVKIFLWFNPFVYLFKDLIQKNHEYLADSEVIRSGIKAGIYADNILDFTSKPARYAVASSFNINHIKNRIIMLSKTTPKRSLQIALFSTIIFVTLFSVMAFEQVNDRFRRNPTEMCDLTIYRTENLGGYIINGDSSELFMISNERGYRWAFSKIADFYFTSNTFDTAIWKSRKFNLKEFDGQILIDDEFIGEVKKGEMIVIKGDKTVDVYDNDKVTIERLAKY